ncbi:lipopolysaccharide heptosyltransferase II [Natronospora cellulosivora (SeqCode)]
MSIIKKAKRILIIDLLYLGDLMFATPFIKELRKNFPEARIDIIVNKTFHDIMDDNPYLDNVYAYNKNFSLKESISFSRGLSKNHYDFALNIHGNWRTALILKLVNPQYSVGYGGRGRGIFLDRVVSQAKNTHMVEAYLNILREIRLEVEKSNPQLEVSDKARASIRKKLNDWGSHSSNSLIALNTGGTWPTKRWKLKAFAELADILNNDYGKVIFIGSKADSKRVAEIIDMMESEPLLACGKTSLKELAALVEYCDLVISNDSGPVHVAAAVGTPTITIFGPSNDQKYRPLGDKHRILKNDDISCRPCGEHQCPLNHHKCMEEIEVSQVLDLLDNFKMEMMWNGCE